MSPAIVVVHVIAVLVVLCLALAVGFVVGLDQGIRIGREDERKRREAICRKRVNSLFEKEARP